MFDEDSEQWKADPSIEAPHFCSNNRARSSKGLCNTTRRMQRPFEFAYAAVEGEQKTSVPFQAGGSTKRETDDGLGAGTKPLLLTRIPSPGWSHYWRPTKPPTVTVNTRLVQAALHLRHRKLLILS
ncbi:hypothetical protein KM043_011536 [Ampulex compressa]|nr:hypothetical protein KM043_011536 [Ampulex compressa]